MTLTVRELEELLFEAYPKHDVEPWDKVGLSVGNPLEEVKKIAVSLDVTVNALRKAKELGANVLLAHHPIFIDSPFPVIDQAGGGINPSSSLFEAAKLGISVISMHTNLDRSQEAIELAANLLDAQFIEGFEDRFGVKDGRELGRLGSVNRLHEPMSLKSFARLASSKFGRVQSVWGELDSEVKNFVWASGSASSLVKDVVNRGNIDCLLCGECSYHNALDASLSDLKIVILGHDVSELPFKKLLADRLIHLGLEANCIVDIDQSKNWFNI